MRKLALHYPLSETRHFQVRFIEEFLLSIFNWVAIIDHTDLNRAGWSRDLNMQLMNWLENGDVQVDVD